MAAIAVSSLVGERLGTWWRSDAAASGSTTGLADMVGDTVGTTDDVGDASAEEAVEADDEVEDGIVGYWFMPGFPSCLLKRCSGFK